MQASNAKQLEELDAKIKVGRHRHSSACNNNMLLAGKMCNVGARSRSCSFDTEEQGSRRNSTWVACDSVSACEACMTGSSMQAQAPHTCSSTHVGDLPLHS